MAKVIFPPRPRGKCNPSDLPYYEGLGTWIVQRKFNDTRNLLHVEPGLQMTVWSRHGCAHKRFSLNTALREEIVANLKLDKGLEYWIDGGVMNKTKDGPNCLILFDLLQAGPYFFAKPDQMGRLALLSDICGNPTDKGDIAYDQMAGLALKVSDNIWLAETFTDNFVPRFNEALQTDLIEGLVLRRKDSCLENFGRVEYEVDWQIRCRKPHKNYNF